MTIQITFNICKSDYNEYENILDNFLYDLRELGIIDVDILENEE